jgi:hypothetical protein
MNENLVNFLVDLASDRHRMASFAADPHAVLDDTALSADERDAVLAGDSARLRRALGAPVGGKGSIRVKKKAGRKKTSGKKRPGIKRKKK